MAGRSFDGLQPRKNNRRLLQRALKLPQVSDGVIQGKSVRLILKKEASISEVRRRQLPDAGDRRNRAAL
jgi:ABC-2 type transport system ATP-binding protein